MTKFSNIDNEDFKKVSRTLEFMLEKSGPQVENTWALEARMKKALVLKSAKRTFMVPFERDSNFVGRMDVITELDQTLNNQRRVALAGAGGIGKSQIAIEYCYRFRDRHPDASVFWVHVGTISRFKQAYEAIANDLGLIGKDNPKANLLQLIMLMTRLFLSPDYRLPKLLSNQRRWLTIFLVVKKAPSSSLHETNVLERD
ncbi:hypothetical protein MMC22_007007 [Lobaria immixta]|nr:hypothetical protein [Lobaria immixta]